MKLHVGLPVWYHPGKHDAAVTVLPNSPRQPCHATVIHVVSDYLVKLEVIDHAGTRHILGNVPFLTADDIDSRSIHGYCEAAK